ncbi:MAG: heme lyase CcmF/NrfE family subunit [Rhodospirillales bacterium]|nr:heme lyase CcmF/NrfE family subunit [Rhodospirillales bacterium]
MIPEIGHYALLLALCIALAQASVPLVGAARRDAALMAFARPAALAQFAFVAIAFFALMYAYVVSDFTVRNVVENSHSLKPMFYKVAGVWANHEGSMVLWVLILTLFGAAVAAFGDNLPPSLRARVLAVQAMIGVAFLAFIVFTSNPFLRVDPPPIDGRGLNPLLQDPGLVFHPPFLYLGYVGFSTSFSFAVAALIEGRVDAAWARWVRPWTLAAWSTLTFGIALGSWWAYYELGWGGWWFWDPVENASFMPWLVGTALLHSAIVAEKRGALKTWTILLAILAFALSLIGTFLVRSGVLTSVHAFAVDPARGVFILLILILAIGGSLALYAIRAPQLKIGGLFAPISREGALVLNNLLLSTACATVFLGTLYPLFLDAVGAGKVSVGPPFFNATFVPLMIPLAAATAIGPLLAWKRGDLAGALGRLWAAAVISGLIVLATLYIHYGSPVLALVGMGLAAWLAAGVLVELAERIRLFRIPLADSLRRAAGLPRAAWGMSIAHFGLAVTIAGITASSAWQIEKIQIVRPDETIELAGYELTFKGVKVVEGPNYTAREGTFEVTRNGRPVVTLQPAKRFFPVQGMTTTEAAIHSTGFADIYAVIGDLDEGTGPGGLARAAPPVAVDGAWTARLYYNPLVPWIWFGATIMVIGGMVSLTDRRHRVGAPKRARIPAGSAPALGD